MVLEGMDGILNTYQVKGYCYMVHFQPKLSWKMLHTISQVLSFWRIFYFQHICNFMKEKHHIKHSILKKIQDFVSNYIPANLIYSSRDMFANMRYSSLHMSEIKRKLVLYFQNPAFDFNIHNKKCNQ